MKNKFLAQTLFVFAMLFEFYIKRPVKAVGAGLTAFSNALGMPGGVLYNVWTTNQNCDAPTSSTTVSIAAAGTGTANAECVIVTITGLNAAAGATQSVTVNNSSIVATSRVFLTLNSYSGTYTTDGEPCLTVATVAAGSVVIRVKNLHAANALNGSVTVALLVHQVIV